MNILALNCGSSSVKYALVRLDPAGGDRGASSLARGLIDEIGSERSRLRHSSGPVSIDERADTRDHEAAVRLVLRTLVDPGRGALADLSAIEVVGHRVVHGGAQFRNAALVDDAVLGAIRRCGVLAPLHNPHNMRGVEIATALLPHALQIVVFDTAFHADMPAEAATYALPLDLCERLGIRRYGFHGISHSFVAESAADELGRPLDEIRLVTCHLGNGASVAAVKGGRAVDTSMGMTPLEGLVMGTRCGDLDPAIVLHLIERGGLSTERAYALLNEESGLLGLSGRSSDMRELLQAAEAGDGAATLAVSLFCYRVRKYVGAYAAAMGGVDAVVFTGGIGENEPTVRRLVCEGLGFLGVGVDDGANQAGRRRIGTGPVDVLVVATDEELAIALEAGRVAADVGSGPA